MEKSYVISALFFALALVLGFLLAELVFMKIFFSKARSVES